MNTPVEFITWKETARLMGQHYETLRRRRALGYYRELRVFKAGPRAKEKVLKESVYECIKAHLQKAG